MLKFIPIDHLLIDGVTRDEIARGWGVPTATDIALAWLVASIVFGKHHPAVSFLLVLAIIDDAIGLGIIAIFYPSPEHAVEPIYLTLPLLGMLSAYIMRIREVHSIYPYLLVGGVLSWGGLFFANLHPALGLVVIVPFMSEKIPENNLREESTLNEFENTFHNFVNLGLFGFGIANAGVLFSSVTELTWIILGSLIGGKVLGVFFFSMLAVLLGFKLPKHVHFAELILIGIISGLGLTVALFVAGEAYPNTTLQLPAKMGALFSVSSIPFALILAKFLRVKKILSPREL